MEEAPFSYTVKDKAGNLLTIRGNTAEEFLANAQALDSVALAGLMGYLDRVNEAKAVQTVLNAMPGSEVIATTEQQLPQNMNPRCKDCGGATRYEEWVGKNGKNAGKQFKAYKCITDKDHRPEWVS